MANDETEVLTLYQCMIDGWNNRDAKAYADQFTADGIVISFDGSLMNGSAEIAAMLGQLFADYVTPTSITKVKALRFLGSDVALLQAIAGVIPAGQTEFSPERNAHQAVVASRQDGEWRIVLFQNTPAPFQGRPELMQQMTDELRQVAEPGK